MLIIVLLWLDPDASEVALIESTNAYPAILRPYTPRTKIECCNKLTPTSCRVQTEDVVAIRVV